jgi:valyl-tRNA synthetase
MEIEKVYEPQRFEPHWAKWWEESQIFHVEARPGEPYFSLSIPPPNVTGSLHIGHMFEHSIIDAQIRWRRMLGVHTLWLPGTDHAGIATELMVDRQLAAEGIRKRDLGREAFIARVWEWRAQYGGRILEQMKRAGMSCDWSRTRFTFEPHFIRAAREVFVTLFDKGLIYQADYIVNWCPRCQTVLSDLEVEHEDVDSSLWHIRYPVNGSGVKLVVATTRPETMLGDTAVAINPKDPRAGELAVKTAQLPLMDRAIPIILDDIADPEFGSGAVKITPAHDPNDFEAAKRHDLASIQVIGPDAKMTAAAGRFAGLDRYEARKQVVAALQEAGVLEKIEPYKLSVGKCHRCKTVVEPLVSKQWWMRMKPLAKPAIEAVEDGRIKFVPENWTKVYFEWMYNIRDWCISRQLWWGHRIPAWHCADCKGVTVARDTPDACAKCGSKNIEQDPDVLDTWFSSGLWPFVTLGWPDKTPDLAAFYPNTLLVTGFDIIFFWAARMIMLGMEFMGDVPFRHVHIHGLVRDAERQKMSKTKGNVIDPLVMNDKFGTDAVRFALIGSAAPGADIALSEERIDAVRAFANKIWNASRLLFSKPKDGAGVAASLADRWIVSRLNATTEIANRAFEAHRYKDAADALWHFFWDDFCDWYLELKKLEQDWSFAYVVYERALRLMHPLMPFLTEELWQRLETGGKSIAIARYPQAEARDEAAESEMRQLQGVVTEIRQNRAANKVDRSQELNALVFAHGDAYRVLDQQKVAIERLGNVKLTLAAGPPQVKLNIPIDKARLEKEIQNFEKQVANLDRQFASEEFMSKAPAKVIDGMRQKRSDYEAQIAKNRATLGGA